MKSEKRRRAALAAAVMLAVLALCLLALGQRKGQEPAQQGNLLENGQFTETTDGMPDGWTAGMWVTSPGASYLEAVTLEDGTRAALVENAALNDARFEQTVAVRENTTYRLTARIRAEGCDTTKTGANLSFLGIYGTSRCLYDTQGEFEIVSVYARTGRGQTEATVCLRLGGYGSENAGRAWFADVELVQVDDAPVGETVLNISTPAPQKEASSSSDAKGWAIPGSILVAVLYLAVALFVVNAMRAGRGELGTGGRPALLTALLLGALLRLGLAAIVPGYGVDMGCFGAWAGKMAASGPAGFYEEGYFCDYPPGYLLVLWLLGGIAKLTGASLAGMDGQMLLKLVPIACDIALSAAIWAAARREMGTRAAMALCVLTVMNPAYVVTGSCWGQIDSVLALLLVALLLAARQGRWQAAIPLFALAVLVKPQAGLLAPLGLAALGRDVLARGLGEGEQSESRKRAALGIGLGVAVTLVIVLPFSPRQSSPLWLVEKYRDTLSSYNHATLSTGNLMFLLGGNWKSNAEVVFGSVTYGQLGAALMALSFAAGIAVYLRGRGRSRLLLASAMTMQLLFVLGTKMHERYILPALALLLLAYLETRDIRLLAASVLASMASAVNIAVVLAFDYLVAPNLWLGYALGVLQLLAAALTVWAAVGLSLGRPAVELPKWADARFAEGEDGADGAMGNAVDRLMREELLHAQDYRMHFTRRDAAIMLAITAVYAAVGFYHLGQTSAPQTGYASSAAGESVTIDLGERYEDFHIYYYGGISDTAFSVATSDDGIYYGEEAGAFFDKGECFKWLAVRPLVYNTDGTVKGASGDMLRFSGRYLRVTFDGAGASLWEIAAVTDMGEVLPAVSAEAFGAREGRGDDADKLIDEQDVVPEVPSYYNSMYFDEIYHARTGYEHAHSLATYENTHPPLGKVFMSWCIRLMGMTPFAWRFAGALCGVLMIPAIYLLAKQLFGKTRWAALCALLLSSDCMHYTQTRIATIDSFPVLFMILMFLFMARWMKMSFYHQRLAHTFVPLALSGLFMGLAIASKWIGCYGAIGLAVLFFARFWNLWLQSVYAKAHKSEDPAFARAANLFAGNGLKTILACCVFFVAVPVVIYALSYIPYLRYYGEVKWNMRTIQRIIDAQITMFRYHSGLDAEHYFGSPWYEWPLIMKPMWYYNADFKGAGMASSIMAFGNPAVWWTGFVAMLFVLLYSTYRNALFALRGIPGREDEMDRAMPVIAVGFLSGYLPWVLVSRLTFIYHYFASVPFIILATAQVLRYIERKNARLAHALYALLVVAAIALFIAFYPLASGMEVPRAWCDAVSWFDNWMWY